MVRLILPVSGMTILILISTFFADLLRPAFLASTILLEPRLSLVLLYPHPRRRKKRTPTRRANQIQVDVNDPLASLVIPAGLNNHQVF